MFSAPITSRAALALVLFGLVFARPVPAQVTERAWAVGVAAGVAAQPDNQDDHLSRVGWHGAANLTVWASPSLGFRLEGLTSDFAQKIDHIHAPCPPNVEPTDCHAPVSAVRLRALTLGGIARQGSAYASLGGGVYWLAAHPTDEGRTRPGLVAAVGRTFGTQPTLALEFQLHWIPGVELGGEWHAPLRLGLVW